jgi:predicted house-cleaning noncanonical NTP pyrophosphatase (MazG superfamily)
VTFREPRWKLVRDKLPEKAGPDCVHKTESPAVFEAALRLKLIEEAEEAARALTRDALIDEMVDVMEVLSGLGRFHKISPAELNERSKKKREEKGAFTKAVFMLVPTAPIAEERQAVLESQEAAKGMKCSVCGEPQHGTPSGVMCPNGHGGAPGVPI